MRLRKLNNVGGVIWNMIAKENCVKNVLDCGKVCKEIIKIIVIIKRKLKHCYRIG